MKFENPYEPPSQVHEIVESKEPEEEPLLKRYIGGIGIILYNLFFILVFSSLQDDPGGEELSFVIISGVPTIVVIIMYSSAKLRRIVLRDPMRSLELKKYSLRSSIIGIIMTIACVLLYQYSQ